jgi:hypothetical protein
MAIKHSSNYYRLHSRCNSMSIHISRLEAQRLLNGLTKVLKQKRSKGHREYFIMHVMRGCVWSKISVTHPQAHKRHCAEHADRHNAQRQWVRL